MLCIYPACDFIILSSWNGELIILKIKFRICYYYYFLIFTSISFSLIVLGLLCMLDCLILFQGHFTKLSSFFFPIFFFYVSIYIVSTDLISSSLKFSSALFNLLISPPSKIFILYIFQFCNFHLVLFYSFYFSAEMARMFFYYVHVTV